MVCLVKAENLRKTFIHEGQRLHVLKGVDLEIDAGEMLCIVGASGAGKSTLLHVLGTLEKPTEGKLSYEGTDVTQLSGRRLSDFRNRSIGFVFQFHHLLPEFSALENVMMPGLIRGLARDPLRKKASEILHEVGLRERKTHRPAELSGGEQQRVALARALIMDPKLILADEPTGNLDSETSVAIRRLLFKLNKELGTAFLIVTHSQDLAAEIPRVVEMKDGRVETDTRKETPLPSSSESKEWVVVG